MTRKIKKIAIIKLHAIGDVVMSSLVIENLAVAFPDAEIDFVTEKFCSQAVLHHPQLSRVVILDKKSFCQGSWRQKLSAQWSFLKQIRTRKYDLVFDFFGNPRSAILTLISGAPIRVGYDYRIRRFAYNHVVKSRANELHEAEWHLDALVAMDIPIVSKKLVFHTDRASDQVAEKFWHEHDLDHHRVVGLNFSGGWPAKRWPLERFAALADRIAGQFDCKLLLIWGPGELEDAQHLQKMISAPSILIPDTDLTQLAAILKKVEILVSTDSGPAHIAAAVETPCVAIFGPTNPDAQGPYGQQHVVVRKETLACLGCNQLTCSHRSCMELLQVEDLFDGFKLCNIKNEFPIERRP